MTVDKKMVKGCLTRTSGIGIGTGIG